MNSKFGRKMTLPVLLLWQEIFEETSLNHISVMFAHRLTDSLKNILVHKKPSKQAIRTVLENLEE
jgi:hypothetical protein